MDKFANLTRAELQSFAEEQVDLMIRYRLLPESRREIEIQEYVTRFFAHATQQRREMDA